MITRVTHTISSVIGAVDKPLSSERLDQWSCACFCRGNWGDTNQEAAGSGIAQPALSLALPPGVPLPSPPANLARRTSLSSLRWPHGALGFVGSRRRRCPFAVPGSAASRARPTRRLVLVPGSVDATPESIQDREWDRGSVETPNIQGTVHVPSESVAEAGKRSCGIVWRRIPVEEDDSYSYKKINVGGRRSAMRPNPNVNRFRHQECGLWIQVY